MTTSSLCTKAAHAALDPLLRKPQVCSLLGISEATVDRWVNRGLIRRIKLSERISVYPLSDLHAFIEKATASTVDTEAGAGA